VVGFDNPVAPSLFDQLVEATGAESIDWPMKLECCGAPLWGVNDRLSMDLTLKKLTDGKKSGADYVCTACPYCHLQFDQVQKMILSQRNLNHPLPSVIYPQLLGLTLGIDRKTLGMEKNEIPITGIEELLATETELAKQSESTEKTESDKE
jgi:heterodisulfide reductase subunit B